MKEQLAYFPSPYPDEDFRSVVKRFHKRSGIDHESVSRKELFDTNSSSVLPRNMFFFFQKLPDTYRKEYWILQHTLFPLLMPFIKTKKKRDLLEDIYHIKGATNSAGVYLNGFISKELRYCPGCKSIDNEKYGEYYARRFHQLEGFNFCKIHKNALEYETGKKVALVKEDIELLIPILDEIEYLLNSEYILIEGYELNFRYIAALFEKGYLTKNGKPMTNRIIDDLMAKYRYVLKRLGIDYHYLTIKNRIWKMINLDHKTPNPFLHIMMMLLLKNSTANFFISKPGCVESKLPFGTGPWNCKNHLCEHFNSSVIRKCERKLRKSSLPTAEFQCPFCGFTYVRNIEDTDKEYKTVYFGEKWEKSLVLKYKETKSLKITAVYCGVKEPVARKYLNRLSPDYKMKNSKDFTSPAQIEEMIKVYRTTKSIRRTSLILGVGRKTLNKYLPKELVKQTSYYFKNKKEKTTAYKQKIIDCINASPNSLRYKIKENVGSDIYKYLMKEEKDWMEDILPPKYDLKKDWSKEDERLIEEIIAAVDNIKKQLPKWRITKNLIISNLSSTSKCLLQNNLSKLDKTLKVLGEQAESIEEYQIRKLDYALGLLKKNHNTVTLATIKALPAYRESSAAMDEIIQEKINNLKNQ